MKGSVKLFIASLIVFACALGFFAGSLCFGPKGPCNKGMMPPPPPGFEMGMKPGQMPPPGFDGKGPQGHEGFQGRRNQKVAPEYLDSLLQVTAEQKAKIEVQRTAMDSSVKAARQQKKDADKQLREAMEKGDMEQIKTAKANILAAQSLLLDLRVQGFVDLSQILTKEQMEKFRAFNEEQQKKNSERKGPKGNMPPPPPQHK